MIRFFKWLLKACVCLGAPWLVLLFRDNPGGALVALLMQASIIGWPFAVVWAWRKPSPSADDNQDPEQ